MLDPLDEPLVPDGEDGGEAVGVVSEEPGD
jgi:hypothetical protein